MRVVGAVQSHYHEGSITTRIRSIIACSGGIMLHLVRLDVCPCQRRLARRLAVGQHAIRAGKFIPLPTWTFPQVKNRIVRAKWNSPHGRQVRYQLLLREHQMTAGSLQLPIVFLPRDAMHKRGLCRHAVSVCLSVCYVREFRQNE